MNTAITYKKTVVASVLTIALGVPLSASALSWTHYSSPFLASLFQTSRDNARCLVQIRGGTMAAGSAFKVVISMQNSGGSTWKQGKVSLQSPTKTWGESSAQIDASAVRPGGKATFTLSNLTVPTKPGTYDFEWQMASGKTRFGEACKTTITVPQTKNGATYYARSPYLPRASSSSSAGTTVASVSSSSAAVTSSSSSATSTCDLVCNMLMPSAPVGCTVNTTPATVVNGCRTSCPSYSVVCASTGSNLYVTSNPAIMIPSRQLLGGTLGDPVLQLKMQAVGEPVEVTMLQVVTRGSLANSVDSIQLFQVGQVSPLAIALPSNCTVNVLPGTRAFCAAVLNQKLVVTPGQDTMINVKPVMKTDANGGISGEPVQLMISSQAVSVQAKGTISHSTLLANNGNTSADGEIFIGRSSPAPTNADIIGTASVAVMSKFGSITNANVDPNGTPLSVGDKDIGVFSFTALQNSNTLNGANLATLSGVLFSVQSTNIALDSTKFYFHIYGQNVPLLPCTPFSMPSNRTISGGAFRASGALLVQCLMNGAPNTQVSAGSSLTVALRAYVDSNRVNGGTTSNLITSLFAITNANAVSLGSGSHIQWGDIDSGGRKAFYWVDFGVDTVNSTSYSG